MLNDVKLGLKDLWKDKILALFYVLFFAAVLFILVSTSLSMAFDIQNNNENVIVRQMTSFQMFITGLKPDNPEALLRELSDIYQENAYTYCDINLSVDNGSRENTRLIFGDPSVYYSYLKPSGAVTVFAGSNLASVEEISLNGKSYKVDSVLKPGCEFWVSNHQSERMDNRMVIVIPSPSLEDWISMKSSEIIAELTENTLIDKKDQERIRSFLDCTNSDFMTVRQQNYDDLKMREIKFVLKIMYPYGLVLLVSCILATAIVIEGTISRRAREFTLHILHGAGLHNIVVRLMTYYVMILLFSIALGVALHMFAPHELWIYGILCVTILLILLAVVVKKVKKKNLFENLRNHGNE